MDVTSPKTRSTNSGCGPGTNLNIPTNGVIYVQNVPTSSSDPELLELQRHRLQRRRESQWHTQGTAHDRVAERHPDYRRRLVLDQYPSGTDVLGLVANNNVAVYHPVSNGNNAAGTNTNVTIDAAILAFEPLVLRAELVVGCGARHAHGQRRDRAGVSGSGRNVQHVDRHREYRLQQELQLRHATEVSEPAVLPEPDVVVVGTDLVLRVSKPVTGP